MNRKVNKILGITVCALISLASHKIYAQASNYYNVTRLSGINRYDTSASISNYFSSKEVKNVIIANGNSFPDSLAGSVLSKKLDAPILLVSNDSSWSDYSTLNYIYSHLSQNGTIYVLGGEGAISTSYLNDFQQQGYNNLVRLGGSNRFETNIAIVDEMKVQAGTPVVLVNGLNFADALSISSVAASKGYPILMSNSDTIPDNILQKLTSIRPSKVYMIGGTGALSDNIRYEVQNALTYINNDDIVRISGSNRFETSINVCNYFKLDSQSVVIANGSNFPDALSGSALAAKLNAPILLIDGISISEQKSCIDSAGYDNVIILGGEGAVNSSVENVFPGTKVKVDASYPENSDNKIVDFKNGDVNGDGVNENVLLTCDSNDIVMLFIQDPRNGRIIESKTFDSYISPYGQVILADVDGDKIDDILSFIDFGGTSGNEACDIETFKNNKLNVIAEEGISEGNGSFSSVYDDVTFSLNGWSTLNMRSEKFNKNYSVDLTKDQYMQEARTNREVVDPYLGHGPRFFVSDVDGDGIYEVQIYMDISGAFHADVLAGFITYYKYIGSSWNPVKFDVVSEYTVIKR